MPRQDCSNLATLAMPESACMAVAIASIETFPRESMGALFSLGRAKVRKAARVSFAVPFQSARRGERWCWSKSSTKMARVLGGGRWRKLADFHSHTHRRTELPCADPSEEDLEDMSVGEMELVVAIVPTAPGPTSWSSRGKNITGKVAGFRFIMKAWVKRRGMNARFELNRDQVGLELEEGR